MTMTTLLTREQVDSLRSIGDSALVLFAMWMIDKNFPGRTTKPTELLPCLYPTIKDIRTLEARLNALCASGRLAKTTAGYVLLEGGRAMVLGMSASLPEKDLAQSPALNAGTSNAQAQDPENDGEGPRAMRAVLAVDSDARNARALEEVEESLILKDLESTSSTSDAQNALTVNADLTTAKILAATPVLDGFGPTGVVLSGLGVNLIDPRHALAWIAQAFDQRERPGKRGLHNPASLVYSRLKDPAEPRPQARYHNAPLSFLPENYLELLGLITYSCEECSEKFGKRALLDLHTEKTHPPVSIRQDAPAIDPVVFQPISLGRLSPWKAWEGVLAQLQMDMPRASFDTWARDTQAIKFEGSVLSVGVRNAYARDWLDSRLTSTVQRILIGIVSMDVQVCFVVAAYIEDPYA